jgi:HEAT repeat protein
MSGLLHEAEFSQKNLLDYLPKKIDSYSIRELITDNLNNSDFRVRAWSAYSFRGLSLSAGSTAAQRLGELLSDPEWFVRFMAVYSLEPIADLTEYLNWVSTIDENELVNRQAKLQLQQPWEVIEMPLDIPEEAPATTDKSSDDLWMEIY